MVFAEFAELAGRASPISLLLVAPSQSALNGETLVAALASTATEVVMLSADMPASKIAVSSLSPA